MFFTAAAILAMVRHSLLEKQVHSGKTTELEEPLISASSECSLEAKKSIPLPEDALKSMRNAVHVSELIDAGKKMAKACARYRMVHGIALASATCSAISRVWNLVSGTLPSDPVTLPMSARAAAQAAFGVSMILIVTTSSSI